MSILAASAGPEELWMIDPQVEGSAAAIVKSHQGLFIINAFDEGVGWQLRTRGACDAPQMALLELLGRAACAGAVVLDIGANIGVTSAVLARAIGRGGRVHAFEPQRAMFHMLAGNMALNGIDQVVCNCIAVGAAPGVARLPRLDYRAPAIFGSVELNRDQQSDARQQARDNEFEQVPMTSIDALGLPRVDLIKIDVEGMEHEVLEGARVTIARDHPLMYVEHLKCDKRTLALTLMTAGYRLFDVPGNFVCIPAGLPDPTPVIAGLTEYSIERATP